MLRPRCRAIRQERNTAADNHNRAQWFVIFRTKKVKLILVYPITTGRNFDEVPP